MTARGWILLVTGLFPTLSASPQTGADTVLPVAPWDAPITLAVNRICSPGITDVSLVLSDMLTPTAIVLPPTLVITGHIIARDRPGNGHRVAGAGVRVGLSALTSHVVVQILKHVIDRPRPFRRPELGFLARAFEDGASFPSGHASVSAAIATSLSLSEPRVWIIVPSVLWSACMAFSRMHLGVHYFGDVLAGMILGAAMGAMWHGLRDRVTSAADGILPNSSATPLGVSPVNLVSITFPLPEFR